MVPLSVDDDAPEPQHKNTNEGLRAPRGQEYHGEASEDFDDRPSDDEDEDWNESQSLRSRLASALAAGKKSLEDGREWFGRSSIGTSRSSSQTPPRPLPVPNEISETNERTKEGNETRLERQNAETKRDNALAPAENTRISAGQRTPAWIVSKARGGGGGGDEGVGEESGSSSELSRGIQV